MDATFEQGADQPLMLTAETDEDLAVISALTQDALAKMSRIHWMPRRRRFSLLLYRFRWEDADRAEAEQRDYERVATAMTIDDVLSIRSLGVDQRDKEAVFNLLALDFEPGEDGQGVIKITCSGDAVFELKVECLNVGLTDLTRPWGAGGKPEH